MGKDTLRWIAALATGFLGGVISCAIANPAANLRTFMICGIVGCAPTVSALNMTLSKDLGVTTTSITTETTIKEPPKP